jgi:hypothetical protein
VVDYQLVVLKRIYFLLPALKRKTLPREDAIIRRSVGSALWGYEQ